MLQLDIGMDKKTLDRRFLFCCIIFLILFIFTILAWQLTRLHFNNRFKDNFTNNSKSLTHILKKELNTLYSYLYFGQSFILSSENVTRNEFQEFYKKVASDHSNNIYFISYIEKTSNKDVFENTIQNEITEPPRKLTHFSIHPSTTNQEFWVVKYVTSEDTYKEYLGYDVLSDDNFSQDFKNAANSNTIVVSKRSTFINKDTILFIMPVYNNSLEKDIKGFIVLFTKPDSLFDVISQNIHFNQDITFSVYQKDEELPFYTNTSGSLKALHNLKNHENYQFTDTFTLGSTSGRITVNTYDESAPTIFETSILDIGFVLHSLFLGSILLYIRFLLYSNE